MHFFFDAETVEFAHVVIRVPLVEMLIESIQPVLKNTAELPFIDETVN
jgi:hypothetical protein